MEVPSPDYRNAIDKAFCAQATRRKRTRSQHQGLTLVVTNLSQFVPSVGGATKSLLPLDGDVLTEDLGRVVTDVRELEPRTLKYLLEDPRERAVLVTHVCP
jgi:hypothetical protein